MNVFDLMRFRMPRAPRDGVRGAPGREDTVHARTETTWRRHRGVTQEWTGWFGAVMVAPFVALILLGITTSLALSIAAGLCAVLLAWRLWRSRRRPRARGAGTGDDARAGKC